nr:carboxylesterase 5A-like [Lytechinus pictus]
MACLFCSLFLGVLTVILAPQHCFSDDSPRVQIKETIFTGTDHYIAESTTPVYSFRGIYYAESPVGARRFSPPVTKKLPGGPYDATKSGPFCPQNLETTSIVFPRPFPSDEMSEDCLHLDVYTPSLNSEEKLAVMVYFHGGAYANGAGGYYDGSPYALFQNVVLVAANYRLGALGYLSTGDEAAFGNFALLDQHMVLQWIHNHIKHFGGDSNCVTIFGESAGAVNIILHLQSSLSQGFFHRAVSQSGVAHSPIMTSKNPLHVAQRLAQKLSCPTSTTKEMVECLRGKSADDILKVDMDDPDIPTLPFAPVVDGFFIEEDPLEALMMGKLTRGLELLIGVNNHEGGFSNLANRMNVEFLKNFNVQAFRNIVQSQLGKFIPGDLSDLIMSIELMYGGKNGMTDEDAFYQLTEVIGDLIYVVPALALADVRTALGDKVYFYEYQHRMSCSRAPSWVRADHGDEEAIVFGFPFLDKHEQGRLHFTPEEKDLSHILMTYWANFAKTGDPNGDSNTSTVRYWPRYSVEDKDYMKLDIIPEVAQNLKPDTVNFWQQLMNRVHKQASRDEL